VCPGAAALSWVSSSVRAPCSAASSVKRRWMALPVFLVGLGRRCRLAAQAW
jgi:hypothetical protein